MADISKITLLDNNTYNLKDEAALLRISQTKTYTGVIGTANDFAGATFYFGTVMPDDWNQVWSIRYRVYTTIGGIDNGKSINDVCINGFRDAAPPSNYSWNQIASTSYIPFYTHVYYRAKQAGINAGYGHLLGNRLYSAYQATTAASARTVTYEIYECVNCTFTFFDTMIKFADVPGTGSTNYNTYSELDSRSQGLQETGDTNSNTTEDVQRYYATKTGAIGIWATSLCMRNASGLLENICTASDGTVTANNRTTGTTKIANPHGFIVNSPIFYSATTFNANTDITGDVTIYNSTGLFDSRYALNTSLVANSLTPYENIYLVGEINNGLFYLDSTWWTQTPNQTGKIYILLGSCYDSTTSNCRITLYQHNTWYIYDSIESRLVEFEYHLGLTELTYGVSTWNDFIKAYKAHKIVYCSISGGRRAFMAYVNNIDNPTNVEFQYYRSLNAHTVDNQVDEVYVYKLTNANAWTTITRKTGPKVTTTSDLSKTYSNDTLTLGLNTVPVSKGGTGLTSLGTAGQTLVVNSDGDALEWGEASSGPSNIWYGTCSTAADTAAKVVVCPDFTLTDGAVVLVRFENTNTAAAANLTLNVNSTGAKAVKIFQNAAPINSIYNGVIYAGAVVLCYYYHVGTTEYWVLDTNTNSYVAYSDTTTSSWRSLLQSTNTISTANSAVSTTTGAVYASQGIAVQPSTATMRASVYNVADKVKLQYNSTTDALDFVFI